MIMWIAGCGETVTEGTTTGTSSSSTSMMTTTGEPPTTGGTDTPTSSTTDVSATGTSTGDTTTNTDPTSSTTEGVSVGDTTTGDTTTGDTTTGDTTTGDTTTSDTTSTSDTTTGDTTSTDGTTTGDSTGTGASTDTGSESSSTGEPLFCGDGQVGPGELCDDGNADDSDDCTSLCLLAMCGDGFVQSNVDACDDANPVNNDACSNKCVLTPTGVTLETGANTPQAGNVNGGMPYNDPCPAGKLLIGFQGFVGGYHGRIQGVCGSPGLVPAMEGFAVTVTDPVTLPQRGILGNMQWMRMCPMDQAIVGFSGRSGGLVDQLTFTCAPLIVSEAMNGAWSIATGPTNNLAPIGGNGGQPFAQANCPAGQVGAMQRVRAGDGIDAFGLGCSTVSLAF